MGNILGILGSLHVAIDALHMLVSSQVRSWDPTQEIPPKALAGKVILITGGNAGIGRQAALDLATATATATASSQPAEIWIASRNAAVGREVAAEIERAALEARRSNSGGGGGDGDGEGEGEEVQNRLRAHFLELDLTSFASIRKAARTFSAAVSRLDVLILNAGLMGGPAGATTEDGYELRFGLNYVGHALLVKLLLPLLLSRATPAAAAAAAAESVGEEEEEEEEEEGGSPPRIVALSSAAHSYTVRGGLRFDAFKGAAEHVEVVMRYGQSKLAMLLWAQEMAEQYPQITTVSIHPGTVKTELFNNPEGGLMYRLIQRLFVPMFGLTVEDGAKNTIWAATSKNVVNGEYYEPIGVAGNGSTKSKDRGLARKLWEWTEEELKGQEI